MIKIVEKKQVYLWTSIISFLAAVATVLEIPEALFKLSTVSVSPAGGTITVSGIGEATAVFLFIGAVSGALSYREG